MTIRH